jgi:aspartate aminotransferase
VPGLRKAVADRYADDMDVRFAPSEVAITLGGKQAFALACEAILNPGDEVVIPSPYWPTFAEAPRILGAKPVFARLDADAGFAFDPARILAKVSAKTRAVVVNTPSNPTGAVISDAALLEVARGLRTRAGTYLVYDDTYARIQFTAATRVLGEVRAMLGDRLLIAGTASKTYCMTGWRIGWLLAPEPIVRGVSALISHETQCANSFAQFGAIEALTGSQSVVGDLVAEYRARRDMVVSALRLVPGLRCHAPQGAFYAFFDVRGVLGAGVPDSLTYCARLLDEEGVALVAGEGFGCPGFARLSFARSRAELGRGLERIRAFTKRMAARAPKGAAPPRRRRAA